MADNVVPHFHNDAGVSVIEIGSHEFMCVGANPPFDHPHVFLDLGNDKEIICPYCSTLYRFAADLAAGEARPPECVLKDSRLIHAQPWRLSRTHHRHCGRRDRRPDGVACAGRHGFRVVVLEKAEQLEEAGAGLQLSPNATRVLIELGLKERLRAAPSCRTPSAS